MRIFFVTIVLSGCLIAQQPITIPSHPEVVPKEVLEGVDALRADPSHYHLEFENDEVRVLRLTLKGDESVPLHDGRDALVVCLKECHLRFTYPDKRTQDIHVERGKTRWVFGNTRTETNLSPEPLEALFIEQKTTESSK
jgi:hypothetical protein